MTHGTRTPSCTRLAPLASLPQSHKYRCAAQCLEMGLSGVLIRYFGDDYTYGNSALVFDVVCAAVDVGMWLLGTAWLLWSMREAKRAARMDDELLRMDGSLKTQRETTRSSNARVAKSVKL